MPSLSGEVNQALNVGCEIRIPSSDGNEMRDVVSIRVLKASFGLPSPHSAPARGSKRRATFPEPDPHPPAPRLRDTGT